MKQRYIPLALCLSLLAVQPLPVFAQDSQQDRDEGLSLVERGMRKLFDGLIQELEPAMGDMAEAMKELEPMARQLADLIGDAKNYEAPERLENGDIIIRRKADAPPPPDLAPPALPPLGTPEGVAPDGQIDL
jgi:hypothetical protein